MLTAFYFLLVLRIQAFFFTAKTDVGNRGKNYDRQKIHLMFPFLNLSLESPSNKNISHSVTFCEEHHYLHLGFFKVSPTANFNDTVQSVEKQNFAFNIHVLFEGSFTNMHKNSY